MGIAARHGYEKSALSVFMTVAVIGLLLAAGPAGAIEIKISGLSGVHRLGKDIKFTFDVRINHGGTTGELLTNEKYAEVTVDRLYPSGDPQFHRECRVYADEHIEGDGCEFLSVDKIKITGNDNYGYGYGYGYDGETKYPLGYGYGYGYDDKNTHIMYTLSADSKDLGEGVYNATIGVRAGNPDEHVFMSDEAKFYIAAKGNTHNEQEKNEVRNHEINAFGPASAVIFINTTKPVKGSVSVTSYEDNPVWNVKGLSGLLNTKKYLDIMADENILGSLDQAVIKIYYNKNDIKQIDESTLAIYYWNEATETWEYVGAQTGEDENGKYIYVVVDHFSIYALFGSPEEPQPPAAGNSVTGSAPSGSTGSVSYVSAHTREDDEDVPEVETTGSDTPADDGAPAEPEKEKPVTEKPAKDTGKQINQTTPTGKVASVAFPYTTFAFLSSLVIFAVGRYSWRTTSAQRTRLSFEKAFGSIFPKKVASKKTHHSE